MWPKNRVIISRIVLILATIVIAACDNSNTAGSSSENPASASKDGFAGTASCTSCHSAEAALWRNSHHDLAMQIATLDTALGNFNESQFKHNNVTSRFFHVDGALFVETDGSTGPSSRSAAVVGPPTPAAA